MELNDANIQTLAAYLQKTLSPDPTERRGGQYYQWRVGCIFSAKKMQFALHKIIIWIRFNCAQWYEHQGLVYIKLNYIIEI